MATEKQKLGDWGEKLVATTCSCPKCKRPKSTRLLPPNFRCADLICDFCGYLAQVKTSKVKDTNALPNTILGAAWGPQKERMDAGIYFPLYVVLVTADYKDSSVFFLPADLQTSDMFIPRKPLSASAKRAGWQGYLINCAEIRDRFVRLT
ncbi:MAG: DpnI domain-containing protein [Pseudomonadota bacterium]